MKTALALSIAALFLLVTPMLAAAHGGGRHDGGSHHYKGWVKGYHDSGYCEDGRHHKWERRAKKHYKKHLREHRREHRIAKRHFKRHHRQPYYAAAPVVVGTPRIVFRFDW